MYGGKKVFLWGITATAMILMFYDSQIFWKDNIFCLRYGGKRVFLWGITATAVITIFTPLLAKQSTG